MSSKDSKNFFRKRKKGFKKAENTLLSATKSELDQIGSDQEILAVFLKSLRKFEKNNLSIRNLIKVAFGDKLYSRFEESKDYTLTKQIVEFIIKDIQKERNKCSNPSLFIKFIGIHNLKLLNEEELESVITIALKKLNFYISCDKNVIFLLQKVLKQSKDKLSKQFRFLVFEKLLNSFLLYFYEFRKKTQRRDKEMIKNFISHFKLFPYFLDNKIFGRIERETKTLMIQISLATLYIGSTMEERVFRNLTNLVEKCKLLIQSNQNDFFFQKSRSFQKNDKTRELIERELSSFSDYNNCIPQTHLGEELIKTMFIFVSKFINILLKKVP